MSLTLLGLLLLCGSPRPAPEAHGISVLQQDGQQRLQALLAEYNKTRSDFYARLQKIGDAAEVQRQLRSENPLAAYIERFRELAFDAAGTEAGVGAWVWVCNLSLDNERIEEAHEAIGVLLEDHIDSPQWAELATNLRYNASRLGDAKTRETLAKVLAGSPHATVRAPVQFALASLLMDSPAAEDKARGRALFEEMPAKYADVEGGWGDRAKGMLFELDHLQVGMLAPDFEAVDVDGAKWKLSDYKGKVVIVDFWGFW
jgi:hypothetical protein